MEHPLHLPPPPQPSPPSSSCHSPRGSEDWHQYTLAGAPTAPQRLSLSGSKSSRPPTSDVSNTIHFQPPRGAPNRQFPLPRLQVGSQPQRYESLTGLLARSGTAPSFGVDIDDESYKHMSVGDDGSATLDGDGAGGLRRRGGRCRACGFSCRYDSPCAILLGLAGLGAMGVLLGVIFPSDGDDSDAPSEYANWETTSNILGYTYFLAWTLSFYPQIVTNWRHPSKARSGVSLDFVVWNIVGFACYAVYTTSFRYSDVVRREYAERFGTHHDVGLGENEFWGFGNSANHFDVIVRTGKHHHNHTNSTTDDSTSGFGSDGTDPTGDIPGGDDDTVEPVTPQVKANDVAFAWHALLLTIVTFSQIAWCGGRRRKVGGATASREECVEFEHEDDEAPVEGSILGEEGSFLGGGRFQTVDFDENEEDRRSIVGGEDPMLEQLERAQQRRREGHWTMRISSTTKCLVLLLALLCAAGAVIVAGNVDVGYEREGGGGWQWIDYLYFLSFVKVGVSIVKYIPQVVLNYRRKSTSGWQIWNIILDSTGGTLSVVQLVGDSAAEAAARGLPHVWTGIAGNPAKLGLGLVSIFFDVIFLFQHYVLYRHSSSKRRARSEPDANVHGDFETPLLPDH